MFRGSASGLLKWNIFSLIYFHKISGYFCVYLYYYNFSVVSVSCHTCQFAPFISNTRTYWHLHFFSRNMNFSLPWDCYSCFSAQLLLLLTWAYLSLTERGIVLLTSQLLFCASSPSCHFEFVDRCDSSRPHPAILRGHFQGLFFPDQILLITSAQHHSPGHYRHPEVPT